MHVQITVRIEPHTADYLTELADTATIEAGTRISVSQVSKALLERAETEGWKITPARLGTSRPE
jgi:hypothetical protein